MSIINIIELTKIYDKKLVALDNITFSIGEGEFFSLLGKNGAGKSTLLSILMSLVKKTSGKIFVCGNDFDRDTVKVKSLFGFVPQEYNFNQFECVLDVILNQAGFYGIRRSIAFIRAKYLLNFFDLWEKRDVAILTLSGGMKRRLMIVRALIHDPRILILDEPSAGVDVLSRRLIWSFLKDFKKDGKNIILTTHYLEEVENLSDTVAIIDKGYVILKMPVKDLLFKFNKQTILLEVSNNHLINNVIFNDCILVVKNYNLLEVKLNGNCNLNLVLKFLIDNNIIINNIKNKYNRLEELFVDLIS